MATHSKVSRHIPSSERVALIKDVQVGDKIDIEEILGRPARSIQFNMTACEDILEYKLNTLRRIRVAKKNRCDETTLVWSAGNEAFVYSTTGGLQYITESWIQVTSVEITALSLSDGGSIEILAW